MKKLIAILALILILTLASCGGGISDVVDGTRATTPAATTPVETDPVRDSYYEEMEEIRVFEDVYLEILYNGQTYTVTDEDTASSILFVITSVGLVRTEEDTETAMTVRIYRDGIPERDIHYPLVEVTDEETGETKTYLAYVNGYTADQAIAAILRDDGLIE